MVTLVDEVGSGIVPDDDEGDDGDALRVLAAGG